MARWALTLDTPPIYAHACRLFQNRPTRRRRLTYRCHTAARNSRFCAKTQCRHSTFDKLEKWNAIFAALILYDATRARAFADFYLPWPDILSYISLEAVKVF